jgi:hypothetical protein
MDAAGWPDAESGQKARPASEFSSVGASQPPGNNTLSCTHALRSDTATAASAAATDLAGLAEPGASLWDVWQGITALQILGI